MKHAWKSWVFCAALLMLIGFVGAILAQQVWAQDAKIGEVLVQAPAIKHRRILESFQAAHPTTWHTEVLTTLNEVPSKICGECAHLLIHQGKLPPLPE